MPEKLFPKSGGGLFWRRRGDITHASLEARWLAERSAVVGYIIIVVSSLFGSRAATRSYAFACPTKPRGRRTLLVAVAVVEAEGKKEVGANFEVMQ